MEGLGGGVAEAEGAAGECRCVRFINLSHRVVLEGLLGRVPRHPSLGLVPMSKSLPNGAFFIEESEGGTRGGGACMSAERGPEVWV